MKFGIGQPVTRKEDPKFLKGQGNYVSNINLKKMLHGFVLRSPHANARILSIDTSFAQNTPGVVVVLTGSDYEASNLGLIECESMAEMLMGGTKGIQKPYGALVKDYVKCVGVPVAFVIAESIESAKDAAELIEVDYETLPALTSTKQARSKNAPLVWEGTKDNVAFKYKIGDVKGVDNAFATATHLIKAKIVNNRINTNAMEPRACVGIFDKGEQK